MATESDAADGDRDRDGQDEQDEQDGQGGETGAETDAKTCFIICPIGADGSDIRARTDGIIDEIVRPVAEGKGYKVVPPHRDHRAGKITTQVVRHLLDDALVIADLSGLKPDAGPNPNVMYELGIRNTALLPVIHLCQRGHKIS